MSTMGYLMQKCVVSIVLSLIAVFSAWYAEANDTAESVIRLVVLGDSLTAGYGLSAEESFPAQLEKSLQRAGHRVTVVNAGVSGDTTAGGLSRLDWALADAPQLVIVELGGNDALRGLPPEQTNANLDAILTRLTGSEVRVILAGMRAPRNLGPDYAVAFDRIYPRLASKFRVAFYPFFLEGVALVPDLNQADGIHPNASGVAEIVIRILPLVETEIESVRK